MDKYGFINQEMAGIAVNYELGEWTSDIQYPYFVGEFTEEPITTEDGAEETTLILSGFNRGKYIALEEAKKKIKKHFPAIEGLRASIDSGAIAVFFDGAFPIPTGESGFKRIEIRLKIKEWKGDL
jgi:hypothetical protein